ncbi:fibroblast growth factor-binding protein 1 [Sceloporus undulatus]|uniref:fibroblast growth factor-binding protein 1 n=1 Tax=Sceloporus undulatus TaxID=8520 RepID=UPI001C4AECC5|nr:fibroblast growth factor-binding protein 1 [Sceloporus undulatus]
MKFGRFALLCALIMFSQLLQANCERQKGRKKERLNSETSEPDNQNGRGQKTRGQKGSLKGKFTTKEKAVCTWTVDEAEIATLNIDCKKEESTFSCEFSGNPSTCPSYAENKKNFWKQITRSLKKKKNICEDPKGILKSKICSKGPPSAHLRLVNQASQKPKQEKPIHHGRETSLAPATPVAAGHQPGEASSDCVEEVDYIDQRKVAEEYCSETWLSLCNFFISMIQDKKCK